MGKLQEVRQRIQSVEGIHAVTRTLATVAAAKLSRTRRRAAGLRLYARRVREMVLHQQLYAARTGIDLGELSSLLGPRPPTGRIAVMAIAGDRGMCGGYNLEACRLALDFCEGRKAGGQNVRLLLKGRKAIGYFLRRKAEILHQEPWRREGVTAEEVERWLKLLLDRYRSGDVDEVHVVYTEFHSAIRRRPRVVRILPVELPAPPAEGHPVQAIEKWHYEPALMELLDELLAIYLRVQLYDVMLESYASEQGARMITMEEATERADRTMQEYRVLHNRLRREAITIDLLGTLYAARASRAGAALTTGPA
jgi:F-type H+-transporting ATPase subunit gamma